MDKRIIIGALLGMLVILSTAGLVPLAIYKHYVLDVPSAPGGTLKHDPVYRVFEGVQFAAVIIPKDTSDEQDIATVQDLGHQLLARGSVGAVLVCIEAPRVPASYQCMPYLFVRTTQ